MQPDGSKVSLVPRPSHPSLVPRPSRPSGCRLQYNALVLQATNTGVRRPGNEAGVRRPGNEAIKRPLSKY